MSGLLVRDLTVTFGGDVEAVRGVDLAIAPGATLVLLGESGSGKSATARALVGLPGRGERVGGHAALHGDPLLGRSGAELRALRGRRIGLVGQDPSGALDPLRRVGPQLAEVLRRHRVVATRPAARTRAVELLARVGLREPARVAGSFPHELSGGMRQRAAIALAICCGPALLIADEPTTALDAAVSRHVLALFGTLRDELGSALLLVTHDVAAAQAVGGEVAVMYAGRIVERGPAATVLSHPSHPYTRALLAAQPSAAIPRGQLPAIPGAPPAADAPAPPGCAFAPRCAHAFAACRATVPEPVATRGGGSAACLLLTPAEVVHG